MSKTEVQIEVESVEGEKTQFRIGRDGKLLIGFELTKDQMLSVLEHLTSKVANDKSGSSTLTFNGQAEKGNEAE